MTSEADLQSQLATIFGAEASERVQAMNRHLLALEDDPVGEELDEQLAGLFREAHSLKGAAGAVGMPEGRDRPPLESVFQGPQRRAAPQAGRVRLALRGVDAIGPLSRRRSTARPESTWTRVAAPERLAPPGPEPGSV